MKIKNLLLAALLGFGSLLPPLYAQGDTSPDARFGTTVVSQAPAVMIRVPIDSKGRENSTSAELRIITGAIPNAIPNTALSGMWQSAIPAKGKQITRADVQRDSSTFGFFFFNNLAAPSMSWVPAYTYLTFQPTYYDAGAFYQFSPATTYQQIYFGPPANDFGFRYYFYPRFW
jgi:hypothetical protein